MEGFIMEKIIEKNNQNNAQNNTTELVFILDRSG